jgi:hypothetical protein
LPGYYEDVKIAPDDLRLVPPPPLADLLFSWEDETLPSGAEKWGLVIWVYRMVYVYIYYI